MKFWDREREISFLKGYIESEPNAILFLYGPKSSGKTTTLLQAVNSLENVCCFWYDLRAVPISSYDDVLRIFFREKAGWRSLGGCCSGH